MPDCADTYQRLFLDCNILFHAYVLVKISACPHIGNLPIGAESKRRWICKRGNAETRTACGITVNEISTIPELDRLARDPVDPDSPDPGDALAARDADGGAGRVLLDRRKPPARRELIRYPLAFPRYRFPDPKGRSQTQLALTI